MREAIMFLVLIVAAWLGYLGIESYLVGRTGQATTFGVLSLMNITSVIIYFRLLTRRKRVR